MAESTPQNVFPAGAVPFAQRKHPKTICMFDVDGTLSKARLSATKEMHVALKKLRGYTAIAFVGGSDLVKIVEQLQVPGEDVIDNFDYCFSENGLTAFKLGQPLPSASFISHVGEEEYKKMVNFTLRYIADLDIPIKRINFHQTCSANRRNEHRLEFLDLADELDKRNVSLSTSTTRTEYASVRNAEEVQVHKIRETMVAAFQKEFAHLGLTFAIGGQISFDAFPHGWDKTYSLSHIENEGFEEIHFFGDKTAKGGNDYEIFEDPRTIGHTVTSPEHTQQLLEEIFFSKG